MALYLVIHSPRLDDEDAIRPPSKLRELAEASRNTEGSPRWLKTWSPDLQDDRIFTLWEARSAEDVRTALTTFSFLDTMDATPLRVSEWGPADVLHAETT